MKTVEFPRNAIPITDAWIELIDYDMPDRNRMEAYYQLSRPQPNETVEQAEYRPRKQAHMAESFKQELMDRIREGDLIVWAVDVTNGFGSTPVQIPAALFHWTMTGSIDWEMGSAELAGRRLVGLRVAPSKDVPSKISEAGKTGRPNVDRKVLPAIKELAAERQNFWRLTRQEQCVLVREAIEGPGVDHDNPPKGLRDGAIKKRLRELDPS